MPPQLDLLTLRIGGPELDRSFPVAAGQISAIGCLRHGVNVRGVSLERQEGLASRGIPDRHGPIPGNDEFGELKADLLAKWIDAVRGACKKLARLDIADTCIGQLLSHAEQGDDGVWPCEAVRQVMEDIQSKKMMSGAHTGLYNSTGATWRGEGGAQERALADKYRPWANALQYSHPFVASQLLMAMVKTYEREAEIEDTEAGVKRRLR